MCVRGVVCHGRRSSGADRERTGSAEGQRRPAPDCCVRTSTARFRRQPRSHGLRAARHLWQSGRRASLDFAAAHSAAGHPV